MTSIIHLPPGPITEPFVRGLAGRFVALSREHVGLQSMLTYHGIKHSVGSADAPDGAVIVIVPSPVDELAWIVDRLLGPGGCPWD
ncbi:hypothetical protein ACSFB2_13640, partial [Glaesserella parasuis]|uniref:hypothetical protein n=1 Tax=Glaesserella parasuis TaxID=738 RepID=UPI003F363803